MTVKDKIQNKLDELRTNEIDTLEVLLDILEKLESIENRLSRLENRYCSCRYPMYYYNTGISTYTTSDTTNGGYTTSTSGTGINLRNGISTSHSCTTGGSCSDKGNKV